MSEIEGRGPVVDHNRFVIYLFAREQDWWWCYSETPVGRFFFDVRRRSGKDELVDHTAHLWRQFEEARILFVVHLIVEFQSGGVDMYQCCLC